MLPLIVSLLLIILPNFQKEIHSAMKFMYEKAAIVIEPSAAVGIAAIMNTEFNSIVPNGPVACIITGMYRSFSYQHVLG